MTPDITFAWGMGVILFLVMLFSVVWVGIAVIGAALNNYERKKNEKGAMNGIANALQCATIEFRSLSRDTLALHTEIIRQNNKGKK